MRIFNIFRRKQFKPQPKQLRIDGTKTTLTPTPDDAELAAQALLESMAATSIKEKNDKTIKQLNNKKSGAQHDAAYYHGLSEKIRTAHEQERRAAMRYVAYVEEQLSTPLAHREGQGESPFADLERGLYAHQDTVECEGGDLLKRWQHCLAEVIVRQMAHTEVTEKTTTDLTD